MGSPSYLKRRGTIWYAQLFVPLDHQNAVGAKVLTQSLGTSDKAEANRLKHAVLAEMQRRIQGARVATPPANAQADAEALLAAALELRSGVDSSEDADNAERAFDAGLDYFLDSQARKHGVDEHGHPLLPAAALGTIRRAHKAISGTLADTLGQRVEAYLSERSGPLRVRTVDEKRRHLMSFAEWFGVDRACTDVTRRDAGRYVETVIQRRTRTLPDNTTAILSESARAKETSSLRSFFEWVMLRGVIDSNPFDRMSTSMRTSKRGKEKARRPWKPEELAKVLRGCPEGDPLWALAALGAYTGARLEEIAQLKASDVDKKALVIREGKTGAASRRVPIHPVISPLVTKLAANTPDGYLIPGLLTSGRDQLRGAQIGKRFQTLRRTVGLADPRLVFHSFRNTVATQLGEAGVPLPIVQWIIGHEHLNRPGFRRHLAAINYGLGGGGYEHEAVHR
ncbi:tyrosine-type recombinase/integrase [Pseudoxanthomonas sp. UTMC 1351]|uniref:tyrosine-type recombinase/integrase n=1 Tax=Pseudoxanthomonas sp. UTMC 1351 TaxID=2695853 RepID=UPI0034CF230C